MVKVYVDEKGVVRFKGNQIVKDLLEIKMDLNQICYFYKTGKYTFDDYWEFYQLIGYSLDGYASSLSQDNE